MTFHKGTSAKWCTGRVGPVMDSDAPAKLEECQGHSLSICLSDDILHKVTSSQAMHQLWCPAMEGKPAMINKCIKCILHSSVMRQLVFFWKCLIVLSCVVVVLYYKLYQMHIWNYIGVSFNTLMTAQNPIKLYCMAPLRCAVLWCSCCHNWGAQSNCGLVGLSASACKPTDWGSEDIVDVCFILNLLPLEYQYLI